MERELKPLDPGRLREFGEHVSPPQARRGPCGPRPGDSRLVKSARRPLGHAPDRHQYRHQM